MSLHTSTDPQTKPDSNYHISFLRHGESQGNFEGRHQGQADFPLTDLGRQQAKAVEERWVAEKKTFNFIISSPLLRTHETAQMASATLHVPLELDELRMERDNGLLTGLNAEEANEILPELEIVHPYQPFGQTGKSLWEVYMRAGMTVQSLIHRPPGCYLIVSHGGLLNMAFYAILGIAPQPNQQGPMSRFNNSTFATLEYNPRSHRWFVLGVNDHPHWQTDEG